MPGTVQPQKWTSLDALTIGEASSADLPGVEHLGFGCDGGIHRIDVYAVAGHNPCQDAADLRQRPRQVLITHRIRRVDHHRNIGDGTGHARSDDRLATVVSAGGALSRVVGGAGSQVHAPVNSRFQHTTPADLGIQRLVGSAA